MGEGGKHTIEPYRYAHTVVLQLDEFWKKVREGLSECNFQTKRLALDILLFKW